MRVLERGWMKDSRQQMIAEMRAHLERDSFPRLTILWILTIAGCVAFLTLDRSTTAARDRAR